MNRDRKYARAPVWSRALRWAVWGSAGGVVVGGVIGVLVTLLTLVILAPHPQPAAPDTRGSSGDVGISIDDVYLTQVVADALSGATAPVRMSNVRAEILQNNQVKFSADSTSPFPANTQFYAIGQLRVQSGQIVMRFLNAQIGGLPLPVTLMAALERPVNERLAQISADLLPPGFAVTSLTTTDHHLLITIAQPQR